MIRLVKLILVITSCFSSVYVAALRIAFRTVSVQRFKMYSAPSSLNRAMEKLMKDKALDPKGKEKQMKRLIESQPGFDYINAISFIFLSAKQDLDLSQVMTPLELLHVLEKCDKPFTSDEIGCLLYSFKKLAHCPEIEAYVELAIEKINTCKTTFANQNIACSLYGLNKLSDTPLIRKLLKSLVAKFKDYDKNLDDQEIGKLLFFF